MITTLVADLEEPGCKSPSLTLLCSSRSSHNPLFSPPYFPTWIIAFAIIIFKIVNAELFACLPALETPQPLHPCARSSAVFPFHRSHLWSCVPVVLKAGWGSPIKCALPTGRVLFPQISGHTREQDPRDALVPGGVLVRAGACSAMGYKP